MLKIIGLSKSFPPFGPVLTQLNLNVQANDFCVILGSNGSGKSTLLRMILGEYLPDQGKILFLGQERTAQEWLWEASWLKPSKNKVLLLFKH